MSAQPDIFIDISSGWGRKWQPIQQHRSQGRDLPGMEGFFHTIARESCERAGLDLADGFRVPLPT
jgi:hypothetical protein